MAYSPCISFFMHTHTHTHITLHCALLALQGHPYTGHGVPPHTPLPGAAPGQLVPGTALRDAGAHDFMGLLGKGEQKAANADINPIQVDPSVSFDQVSVCPGERVSLIYDFMGLLGKDEQKAANADINHIQRVV